MMTYTKQVFALLALLLLTVAGVSAQTGPPVLTLTGPTTVEEGASLIIGATTTDIDGTTPTLTTSTLPPNAVFTDSGNGAGSLQFDPDFTQSGTFNITFFANDAVTADIDSQQVTITVNDNLLAPVFVAVNDTSITEGQTLELPVSATDAEGLTLLLSAESVPTNGAFVDSANGSGLLTFSPDFTQAGAYPVRFIATDGEFNDTLDVTITVTDNVQPPSFVAVNDTTITEGTTLELLVSATDAEGLTLLLSAEDVPTNGSFVDSTNGTGLLTFTPSTSQAGSYPVRFIANDGEFTDTLVVTITVDDLPEPPAIDPVNDTSLVEGEALVLALTANDPNGTTPTLTAESVPTNGSFTDNGNGTGQFTFNPDSTQSGSYPVTFIAGDGILADTLIVTITVNDNALPPAFAVINDTTIAEGATLVLGVSATDTEGALLVLTAENVPTNGSFLDNTDGTGALTFSPDITQAGVFPVTFIVADGVFNDTIIVTITVSDVPQPPILAPLNDTTITEGETLILTLSASDADGTIPTLSAESIPTNGTFVDSANGIGIFTFTPDTTQSGSFPVTFIASDGGIADTLIVTITVNNNALSPSYTAVNDTTMAEGEALVIGLSATDPEGAPLTLTAESVPANGSFIDNSDGTGTFTFSPNLFQSGTYPITFIATDGVFADTITVTITVTGTSGPPVLSLFGPNETNEQQLLAINAIAEDPDGTTPSLGTSPLPPNATFTDNGTGTGAFRFTPNFDQAGIFPITFYAFDAVTSDIDSELVTIIVHNVNRFPIFDLVNDTTIMELDSLTQVISATDPDGGLLFLSAENLPANATFPPSFMSGTFNFYPDLSQAGIYPITFIVSDGDLADTMIVTYTVDEFPEAPVFNPVNDTTILEGDSLVLNVTAIDPNFNIPVLSAIDVPTNGGFVDSGNGTGTLTFAPDYSQAGVYPVSFVATDGTFDDTMIVTITVNDINQFPTLDSIGPKVIDEGDSLLFAVTASDPEGVFPVLSTTLLPPNASFVDNSDGTGNFIFVPDFTQTGFLDITFYAIDDSAAVDSEIVNITINDINLPPIIEPQSDTSIVEAQLLEMLITASDPDGATPSLTALNVPANAFFVDSANGTGLLTFNPDLTQASPGSFFVTFVASDGLLADTITVEIAVIDNILPPTITPINDTTIIEGQLLFFSVNTNDPEGAPAILTAVNLPANAVFEAFPGGTGSLNFGPDFTQAGVHPMTFISHDGAFADTLVVTVTVTEAGNQPPTLAFLNDTTTTEGDTLRFTVTATDLDGEIPSLFAFGLPVNATFVDSANGIGYFEFAPDFTQAGVYSVTFEAVDAAFANDTVTIQITVNEVNQVPILTFIPDTSVVEGASLALTITASDPDFTTPTLSAVNLPDNSSFVDGGGGSGLFTFDPDFLQSGVFVVTFIADDGFNADSQDVTITVVDAGNQPPQWVTINDTSVVEGTNLTFNVTAADPDNLPVLTALNLPINASFVDHLNGVGTFTFDPSFTQSAIYAISFIADDGSLADTQNVNITVVEAGNQQPQWVTINDTSIVEGDSLLFNVSAGDPDGDIPVLSAEDIPANAAFVDSLNGVGTFTFYPDFTQDGTYIIRFIAGDGILADTQNVQITVEEGLNLLPTFAPVNDTTVDEGGTVVIAVLASDPDGGGVSPALSLITTIDVGSYTFIDSGNGAGLFTYTPDFFDSGLDSVIFLATDFGIPQQTATAGVQITTNEINQPPELEVGGPYGVNVGDTIQVTVMGSDPTDPDTIQVLQLSALSLPPNASFVDNGDNTGVLIFAPTGADVGVQAFTILAIDQGTPQLSVLEDVEITVVTVNIPPVLDPIGAQAVMEGDTLIVTITATDADGPPPQLTAEKMPDNSTFVDSGNGTGVFTYTPSFVQSGLQQVVFKAFDGFVVDKEVVIIQTYEAGPQPPIFDSLPTPSLLEGDTLEIVLTAFDPDEGTVVMTVIDTTLPAFASFVDSGGGVAVITVDPWFTDSGTYNIGVIASDGTSADTVTVILIVIDAGNQLPILVEIGDRETTELRALAFTVSASDLDGTDFPLLSVDTLPDGAQFTDNRDGSGSFNWTPTDQQTGTYEIVFRAQDFDFPSIIDSELIVINVLDTNRVPFIVTSGSRSIFEGDTLEYTVFATDPDGTIPVLGARLDGEEILAPNMVMVDSGNGVGVLTFTPDLAQGGLTSLFYFVRFFAVDGADSTLIKDATAPVQIEVKDKNFPPEIVLLVGPGPYSVTEGDTLTFGVAVNDPDGDSPALISASNLPANATFDGVQSFGTFEFIPNFTQAGTYFVTFAAVDDDGATDSVEVQIDVTEAGNQAPIFVPNPQDTVNVPAGTVSQLLVAATDPDTDVLTLTADPIWTNMTASFVDSGNGIGVYSVFPDALDIDSVFTIDFVATDPSGLADTLVTSLRVVSFLRGDLDSNNKYTMNDLAWLIAWLYRNGPEPSLMETADVNKDGGIDLGDVTYLIGFLYLGGPPPQQ